MSTPRHEALTDLVDLVHDEVAELEHQIAQLNARGVGLAAFVGTGLAIGIPLASTSTSSIETGWAITAAAIALLGLTVLLIYALLPRRTTGRDPVDEQLLAGEDFDEIHARLLLYRRARLRDRVTTLRQEARFLTRGLTFSYVLTVSAILTLAAGATL